MKVKPLTADQDDNQKVVTTKVDERLGSKNYPFTQEMSMFEKSSRNRSANFSYINNTKPKTTEPRSRKTSHNQFDSIAARVGFK